MLAYFRVFMRQGSQFWQLMIEVYPYIGPLQLELQPLPPRGSRALRRSMAGVGSPERVVSEEGAVGWFEAASGVLHRGQGMTEPGVDGRLGMLSASGVDRSDIASTLAKLEDAGHSTSLVEYKR